MTERVLFRAAGGLTLAASVVGPDDGMPVLLAHGGGQTRRAWRRVSVRLAGSGYRAIALDLRGHGESPWSLDGKYDIEDFAVDLISVAAVLGRKPAMIGASLGGLAGLIAEGRLAPGTFASLTLVDITPKMELAGVTRVLGFMSQHARDGFASPEDAARAVAAYLPHREKPTNAAGLSSYLRKGDDDRFYWHWDPAFIDNITRRRADPHAMLSAPNELTEAASRLTLPVHLVRGGSSDLVSPEGAVKFLELVPGACFSDIAGATHMVAGDDNDAFGDAILRFLADTHG